MKITFFFQFFRKIYFFGKNDIFSQKVNLQLIKVNFYISPSATQRRKRAADGFRPSLPVRRVQPTATLRTPTIILMLHLLKIIKIHMLLTLPQIQMAAHGMPQPPPQHHQPINNDQIKNQDQIKIDQINKID